MRQVVFDEYGDSNVLRLADAPAPTLKPNDVLVKVHASSVNPIDWKVRRGINRAVVRKKFPATLGLDFSGVVVETGAEAKFDIGDEVYGSPDHRRGGTYAELLAVSDCEIAKKPTSLSHEEAATIPLVGLTAWGCLVDAAGIKTGEKVFIEAGAGGVGSFAIQLAKSFDAYVATTCSERNRSLVEELGADEVIDYRQQSFGDVLHDYDIALECMGLSSKKQAVKMLRRGGRLASINSDMAPKVKRYGAYLGVVSVGLSIIGQKIWYRLRHGIKLSAVVRKASGESLARIAELIDQGRIRPVIDKTFALHDIAAAHAYSETGRARGKIVVKIAS